MAPQSRSRTPHKQHLMAPYRVHAYVDGFNLYHGLLKGRGAGVKWLDLEGLAADLMPRENLALVWYFTARVKDPPWDAQMTTRQDAYLRALSTRPRVKVMLGQFVSRPRRVPLFSDPTQRVEVLHIEEKGSDVNLATMLVHDAHRDVFDKAIVVSNDSDLAEPIRLVRDTLSRPVMVANPRTSAKLAEVASAIRTLTQAQARRCQLPAELRDHGGGIIRKAQGW